MKRKFEGQYSDYLKVQLERAQKKSSSRFDTGRLHFDFVNALIKMSRVPKIICCMGIRNGAEYFYFKKAWPKITTYGVDLLKSVKEVGDNCFAYDFNNLPKEWSKKFDLVYSNSIDHSYNILNTIDEWKRVLKHGGWLMIEFSAHKPIGADIFQFTEDDMKFLFFNGSFIRHIGNGYNNFVYLTQKI